MAVHVPGRSSDEDIILLGQVGSAARAQPCETLNAGAPNSPK